MVNPPDPPSSAEVARRGLELIRFLDDLVVTSPLTWTEQQNRVVEDVEERCSRLVREQLTELGIPLRRLIEQWNQHLRYSLRQELPRERFLCGFNAVADVVYLLGDHPEELGWFAAWVADQHNLKDRAEALKQAQVEADRLATEFAQNPEKKPPLMTGVKTALEMLAALLLAMRLPNLEWKPGMAPELWDRVREYVEGRRNGGATVKFRMGGASGNMAYVLKQLGLSTTVVWPYHNQAVAAGALDGIHRVEPDLRQDAAVKPATEPGFYYDAGEGSPQPHPVRRSFVFDFAKGLCPSEESGEAVDSSRVIFIAGRYLSDKPKGWKRLILRTLTSTGRQEEAVLDGAGLAKLAEKVWPFFPVFSSWKLEKDALVVEIAGGEAMTRLAEQFDYFMLGGIQALGDPFLETGTLIENAPSEPSVRTILKHALTRQLEILVQGGVVSHWEIGNITSPRLLDDLAEIIRGRVRSAGLNESELRTITESALFHQMRYHCSLRTGQDPDGMLSRYDRAVHLARQLDLDELYVHGNDADLIVRRGATRGALRQEIAITLFAKGVVLLTLLQRSIPDWLDRINPSDVPPVLKADGFLALLELAKGLAMRRFSSDETLERRAFEDMIQSGYHYEQRPDEYSVMVVPVMWPALDIPFSTAGAGDTTSSVVAGLAGK
jgi:ADP-dependent phosphofructokinase/glucokinase